MLCNADSLSEKRSRSWATRREEVAPDLDERDKVQTMQSALTFAIIHHGIEQKYRLYLYLWKGKKRPETMYIRVPVRFILFHFFLLYYYYSTISTISSISSSLFTRRRCSKINVNASMLIGATFSPLSEAHRAKIVETKRQ